ncbi:UNKNOWN [Stylonychia lemnae]|uniref:Uncharacterized protein n=1 Tax=Stylonychia lemnae TaxID=5949 RepID=A0A077ZUF9_STYLE|nr:UNKNOWN [Stylonychia lemnae]|eukprot:CDW72930.1 UNKNOWN [Stylonychia lemnae]
MNSLILESIEALKENLVPSQKYVWQSFMLTDKHYYHQSETIEIYVNAFDRDTLLQPFTKELNLEQGELDKFKSSIYVDITSKMQSILLRENVVIDSINGGITKIDLFNIQIDSGFFTLRVYGDNIIPQHQVIYIYGKDEKLNVIQHSENEHKKEDPSESQIKEDTSASQDILSVSFNRKVYVVGAFAQLKILINQKHLDFNKYSIKVNIKDGSRQIGDREIIQSPRREGVIILNISLPIKIQEESILAIVKLQQRNDSTIITQIETTARIFKLNQDQQSDLKFSDVIVNYKKPDQLKSLKVLYTKDSNQNYEANLPNKYYVTIYDEISGELYDFKTLRIFSNYQPNEIITFVQPFTKGKAIFEYRNGDNDYPIIQFKNDATLRYITEALTPEKNPLKTLLQFNKWLGLNYNPALNDRIEKQFVNSNPNLQEKLKSIEQSLNIKNLDYSQFIPLDLLYGLKLSQTSLSGCNDISQYHKTYPLRIEYDYQIDEIKHHIKKMNSLQSEEYSMIISFTIINRVLKSEEEDLQYSIKGNQKMVRRENFILQITHRQQIIQQTIFSIRAGEEVNSSIKAANMKGFYGSFTANIFLVDEESLLVLNKIYEEIKASGIKRLYSAQNLLKSFQIQTSSNFYKKRQNQKIQVNISLQNNDRPIIEGQTFKFRVDLLKLAEGQVDQDYYLVAILREQSNQTIENTMCSSLKSQIEMYPELVTIQNYDCHNFEQHEHHVNISDDQYEFFSAFHSSRMSILDLPNLQYFNKSGEDTYEKVIRFQNLFGNTLNKKSDYYQKNPPVLHHNVSEIPQLGNQETSNRVKIIKGNMKDQRFEGDFQVDNSQKSYELLVNVYSSKGDHTISRIHFNTTSAVDLKLVKNNLIVVSPFWRATIVNLELTNRFETEITYNLIQIEDNEKDLSIKNRQLYDHNTLKNQVLDSQSKQILNFTIQIPESQEYQLHLKEIKVKLTAISQGMKTIKILKFNIGVEGYQLESNLVKSGIISYDRANMSYNLGYKIYQHSNEINSNNQTYQLQIFRSLDDFIIDEPVQFIEQRYFGFNFNLRNIIIRSIKCQIIWKVNEATSLLNRQKKHEIELSDNKLAIAESFKAILGDLILLRKSDPNSFKDQEIDFNQLHLVSFALDQMVKSTNTFQAFYIRMLSSEIIQKQYYQKELLLSIDYYDNPDFAQRFINEFLVKAWIALQENVDQKLKVDILDTLLYHSNIIEFEGNVQKDINYQIIALFIVMMFDGTKTHGIYAGAFESLIVHVDRDFILLSQHAQFDDKTEQMIFYSSLRLLQQLKVLQEKQFQVSEQKLIRKYKALIQNLRFVEQCSFEVQLFYYMSILSFQDAKNAKKELHNDQDLNIRTNIFLDNYYVDNVLFNLPKDEDIETVDITEIVKVVYPENTRIDDIIIKPILIILEEE